MFTSHEDRAHGVWHQTMHRSLFPHLVEDVDPVPPEVSKQRAFARKMQKIADEERARLKRQQEIRAEAEVLAKTMADEMVAKAKQTPCSPSEQKTQAGVKEMAKKITEAAESKNVSAKAESRTAEPDFRDTIPGDTASTVQDVAFREKKVGNGQPPIPPKSFGGGGSGSNNSRSIPPSDFFWKVGTAILLLLLITLCGLAFTRDLYKEHAKKALFLVQNLEVSMNKLGEDVSFGVQRLALTNKKVSEMGDTVTGTTIAVQSLTKSVSDTKEDLQRTKNAITILSNAVVDPQLLTENANKVSKLEGEIKSLKRNDAKLTSNLAHANASADQANTAVAGVKVEVDLIKEQMIKLSKTVTEGTQGVQGSMVVPQKGAFIKPASLVYMDGSKAMIRTYPEAVTASKAPVTKQKTVPLVKSQQQPEVSDYVPQYHEPVVTASDR